MVGLTFRAQSEGLTVFGDALDFCHTADIELEFRSLANEHSIVFKVQVDLRWVQTVHQMATVDSLRGIDVTPTAESHVFLLKEVIW